MGIHRLYTKRHIPMKYHIYYKSFLPNPWIQVLPSDWLKANRCMPFSKKESKLMSASNYCPISLTSICCKTMEHIIYHSIIQHLNFFNVLIKNQQRFRSQHSCVTQLISLLEDLSYSMDHHQQTEVILLDFVKVFDSVPHQRLLVKLKTLLITSFTGSVPGLPKDLNK